MEIRNNCSVFRCLSNCASSRFTSNIEGDRVVGETRLYPKLQTFVKADVQMQPKKAPNQAEGEIREIAAQKHAVAPK